MKWGKRVKYFELLIYYCRDEEIERGNEKSLIGKTGKGREKGKSVRGKSEAKRSEIVKREFLRPHFKE